MSPLNCGQMEVKLGVGHGAHCAAAPIGKVFFMDGSCTLISMRQLLGFSAAIVHLSL